MNERIQEITTDELHLSLNDPDTEIIDIRPVDAYNGWRLKNEISGGHIRGARSLPFKWTKYMDWIEIVRSKEILPNHSLIIYGYDISESEEVAMLFHKAGYKKVKCYRYFVEEWSANPGLPMDRLERYNHLVYPEWVNDLTAEQSPQDFNGNDFVVCHAHYRNPDDYMQGHIPGAISLDTNLLESPKTWNRRTPEELDKVLTSLGITVNTTVILYGRFSSPDNSDPFPGSSAGHLGAIRCAFIMMFAGVKDVRVLNGGIQSWTDEGLPLSTEEYKPKPVNVFGTNIPAHPELAVDMGEAKKMLASDNAELVSVRSWPEFIGEVSGYNYIKKKGRIPGAVFGNCGSDAYHMENYRNPDHTTREYHEIEKTWTEAGIVPQKHLAFYCGTGWRGSEAFFNAWLMGWPKVSVFDGGWFEWSNDPANPVETGVPENLKTTS